MRLLPPHVIYHLPPGLYRLALRELCWKCRTHPPQKATGPVCELLRTDSQRRKVRFRSNFTVAAIKKGQSSRSDPFQFPRSEAVPVRRDCHSLTGGRWPRSVFLSRIRSRHCPTVNPSNRQIVPRTVCARSAVAGPNPRYQAGTHSDGIAYRMPDSFWPAGRAERHLTGLLCAPLETVPALGTPPKDSDGGGCAMGRAYSCDPIGRRHCACLS